MISDHEHRTLPRATWKTAQAEGRKDKSDPDMRQANPTEGRYSRNSTAPEKTDRATAAPSKIRLPLPVLLYLFTATIPIWFDLGPLNMSTMRLLLIITIIPTMRGAFAGRYGPVLLTDKTFVLYIAWATVAMVINTPSQAIEFSGSFAVEFLGGYFLARAYIRNAADFLALCRWFALIVLATIPFAIMEAKTGHTVILELIQSIPGIHTFEKIYAAPRWGLFRVQMVFAHPIHYGLFCSMGFSLCLISMKSTFSTFFRLLATCGVLLGVFLSLSSGAYMSITMQLLLIVWALIFYRVRARWKILLCFIALCYVLVAALSNRPPITVFVSYVSFSVHNAYWRQLIFEYGMNNVWANPLFGLGLNQWVRPSFMDSGSMDNFWLLEAVRYGIPAFLLLAAGFFAAIWRIGQRDFEGDCRLWNIRRGWVFTFVGLSVTLSTVAVWSSLYSFVFFMFGAGMWMLGGEAHQQDSSPLRSRPAGGTSASPASNAIEAKPIFTRFAHIRRTGPN